MDLKALNEAAPWDWPPNAGKLILEILADGQADAVDRILAAELAGDYTVIDDELVDALLSVLNDSGESEDLRATAAISLGPILDQADMDGFDDPDDIPISEDTFRKIQENLRRLYVDDALPKKVRRRILEASVRAPQAWHQEAVRAAYAQNDEDWNLTAVFAMRWVQGFNSQILEALASSNSDIHYQAICAAGNWEMDAAWSHVSELVSAPDIEKPILLAAIDAAASIRPLEAGRLLMDLTVSDDEDIVEAAHEALAMAAALLHDDFDEDEDVQ
jgi:uncharacterized protein (UPF0147 family)